MSGYKFQRQVRERRSRRVQEKEPLSFVSRKDITEQKQQDDGRRCNVSVEVEQTNHNGLNVLASIPSQIPPGTQL